MQVDTITAPGTRRLKVKCDELVSNFAFKFNLHRYIKATSEMTNGRAAMVRRCRLTLSNPR